MDTHEELWRYCSQILRARQTAEIENVPQTTTITTPYQDATETAEDVKDAEFSASCYEYLKYNYEVLTKYSFATEGIGLFTVAVVGVARTCGVPACVHTYTNMRKRRRACAHKRTHIHTYTHTSMRACKHNVIYDNQLTFY